MCRNQKLLCILFAPLLTFFCLIHFSYANTHTWENFAEPYTKEIEVYGATEHLEVYLPEEILNSYDKIPILIKIDDCDPDEECVFLVNDQSRWNPYRLKGKDDAIVLNRVNIDSKYLKPGQNTFHFYNTVVKWGYFITEIRFDFPDSKILEQFTAEQKHTTEAAKKQPSDISKDLSPPEIIITSHDSTRGIKTVRNKEKIRISGKVIDKSGIVQVLVNSKPTSLDSTGKFEAEVYLAPGRNEIVVSAVDQFENRAQKSIIITRKNIIVSSKKQAARPPDVNYYAVIIGNNNYKYLRNLSTAITDARDVGAILKQQYNFKVKLLLDAKRNDILAAINQYRKILIENDSLLIYYAGHGEFDKTANKAYWLPVDAQSDNDMNWIIVDTITSNIKRISSTHILIVADSCYSGTFTRRGVTDLGGEERRTRYLDKMSKKKSRTLLASGGNEPVSDIGGHGNSVFARAFLMGLKNMEHNKFTAEELYYSHVKEMVSGSSEQTPEYNIIQNSGHEGGDFIFNKNLSQK